MKELNKLFSKEDFELTNSEMEANDQLMPMARKFKLEKELEKVMNWKEQGKTKEEVLKIMDKKILVVSDIDKIYSIVDEDTQSQEELKKEPITEIENVLNNEEGFQQERGMEENNSVEQVKNLREEELLIEEQNKEVENDKKTRRKVIKDEDLIDFEGQPFNMYNEEKEKEMIESIRVNGIIQDLVVRPIYKIDGIQKYQILSGHNRRNCGRKAGLKEFNCIVIYELNDDEAKLYLVETNLATRDKILPTEKARALQIKKDCYERQKIDEKLKEVIIEENGGSEDIWNKIKENEKMSMGNIQRYLRINYLNPKLQDCVDNNRINLKTAEQLSFLNRTEQKQVAKMLEENEKLKISEAQAKKLKKKSQEDKLMNEDIRKELIKEKKEESYITIKFNIEELSVLDIDLGNKEEIKEKILELIDK